MSKNAFFRIVSTPKQPNLIKTLSFFTSFNNYHLSFKNESSTLVMTHWIIICDFRLLFYLCHRPELRHFFHSRFHYLPPSQFTHYICQHFNINFQNAQTTSREDEKTHLNHCAL